MDNAINRHRLGERKKHSLPWANLKGIRTMKNGIIEIQIITGNAAFDDNQGGEVARILRKVADSFDTLENIPADLAHPLLDLNGLTVGHLITKE